MPITMTVGALPDDGALPSQARAALGAAVATRLDRNPMVHRLAITHCDIFCHTDFFTPQECAEMRAMIDAGAMPSQLFAGTGRPDYRTSSSCHLDPADPLVRRLSDRIVALMGIDAILGESLQGQRYHPGQEYREHCDWFDVTADYWPGMRAQGGQRCWTALAYLNSVEEGGETHFPDLDLMVSPREGMILVWNNLDASGAPSPYCLHLAKPVVRGAKHVLTKWFRERPWGQMEP